MTGVSKGYREQDFPRNLGGPLLSLETHHWVNSLSISMPMSLVLPVMAHRQTKPPKESTIQHPSPETSQSQTCPQHI
ncbi:hypothetical protein F4703DRAFT_1934070 [Phycomyces blakesleeanus]